MEKSLENLHTGLCFKKDNVFYHSPKMIKDLLSFILEAAKDEKPHNAERAKAYFEETFGDFLPEEIKTHVYFLLGRIDNDASLF